MGGRNYIWTSDNRTAPSNRPPTPWRLIKEEGFAKCANQYRLELFSQAIEKGGDDKVAKAAEVLTRTPFVLKDNSFDDFCKLDTADWFRYALAEGVRIAKEKFSKEEMQDFLSLVSQRMVNYVENVIPVISADTSTAWGFVTFLKRKEYFKDSENYIPVLEKGLKQNERKHQIREFAPMALAIPYLVLFDFVAKGGTEEALKALLVLFSLTGVILSLVPSSDKLFLKVKVIGLILMTFIFLIF